MGDNVNYRPASNGLRNCSVRGVLYEVKKKSHVGTIYFRQSVRL